MMQKILFSRLFFTVFLVFPILNSAQIEINVTSPAFGERYSFQDALNISFEIDNQGNENIQSIKIIDNGYDGEDEDGDNVVDVTVTNNSNYELSINDLEPGYHNIKIKVTYNSGQEKSEEIPIIMEPNFSQIPLRSLVSNNKLKVFILAGQSNMVGYGQVDLGDQNPDRGTLSYLIQEGLPKYTSLVDGSGNAVVREDVWVTTRESFGRQGLHTTGFGSSEKRIGPEFGFGNILGEYYTDPVLIIKTAFGGKSLAGDFLPPSLWNGTTPENEGDSGHYYNEILDRVNDILNNLDDIYEGMPYEGYEIVGFGWHQGWNDRNQASVDVYETNLVNLIQDLRTDLGVPNMPFVIANSGFDGLRINPDFRTRIMAHLEAQSAVGDFITYPQFEGNVGVVDTRSFFRDEPLSPGTDKWHWNHNFETVYLTGEAMGHSMANLLFSNEVSPPNCVLPYQDPTNVHIFQNVELDPGVFYETTAIDISCATGGVKISVDILGEGGLDAPNGDNPGDYLNIYYKLNGGAQQLLVSRDEDFDLETIVSPTLFGNTLEVIIHAGNTFTSEVYTVSNLKFIESTTLSVTNIENQNITLYPNPVKDILHVNINDAKAYSISLINILGKEVLNNTNISGKQSINVKGIQPGIYFARISTGTSQTVKKIIIE